MAKITMAKVRAIRARHQPSRGGRGATHPNSIRSLAAEFRVAQCTVAKIVRGEPPYGAREASQ